MNRIRPATRLKPLFKNVSIATKKQRSLIWSVKLDCWETAGWVSFYIFRPLCLWNIAPLCRQPQAVTSSSIMYEAHSCSSTDDEARGLCSACSLQCGTAALTSSLLQNLLQKNNFFSITAAVVVQKAVVPWVFNLKVSEVTCTGALSAKELHYLSFPVMFCLFPASSSRNTKQVAGIHSYKKLNKLCAIISGALRLAGAT